MYIYFLWKLIAIMFCCDSRRVKEGSYPSLLLELFIFDEAWRNWPSLDGNRWRSWWEQSHPFRGSEVLWGVARRGSMPHLFLLIMVSCVHGAGTEGPTLLFPKCNMFGNLQNKGHQDDVNAVSGLSYDIQVIFMATEKEKVDEIQNSVKQIVQLHCHCACHLSDS